MSATAFDLTRERIERGLSIRQAEAAIGLSRGVLNRAERGDGIRLSHSKKIADFYGVKVSDIWPIEERAAA